MIATQNQRILELEETGRNMTEVFDKTDIDTISEERENDECVTEYSKNYEETDEKDTNLVGCIKEEEKKKKEIRMANSLNPKWIGKTLCSLQLAFTVYRKIKKHKNKNCQQCLCLDRFYSRKKKLHICSHFII